MAPESLAGVGLFYWERDRQTLTLTSEACFSSFFDSLFLRFSDRLGQSPTFKSSRGVRSLLFFWPWRPLVLPLRLALSAASICARVLFPRLFISVTRLQNPKV